MSRVLPFWGTLVHFPLEMIQFFKDTHIVDPEHERQIHEATKKAEYEYTVSHKGDENEID